MSGIVPFRTELGDYGSHAPVLAMVANLTTGPILELGMGDFSTPMLHLMCAGMGRYLVSVDTDLHWMENFNHWEAPDHKFVWAYEDDWNEVLRHLRDEPTIPKFWDVVFVDHKPGEARVNSIEAFADRATYIVVHDTEEQDKHITPCGANYGYEKVFQNFKHRWDFKRYRPYTTVVSNFQAI